MQVEMFIMIDIQHLFVGEACGESELLSHLFCL